MLIPHQIDLLWEEVIGKGWRGIGNILCKSELIVSAVSRKFQHLKVRHDSPIFGVQQRTIEPMQRLLVYEYSHKRRYLSKINRAFIDIHVFFRGLFDGFETFLGKV